MSKKRDSAYFQARLKKEHPRIYADLKAGKIKSTRQAAAKAGLIRLPGRIEALKREWSGSSSHERRAFLNWVKSSGVGMKSAAPTSPIFDHEGRLTPRAAVFLKDWIDSYDVAPGRIMKKIGFSGFDATLSPAIHRKGQLRREVHTRLASWMVSQGYK